MESPHPMDRLLCGDVGFGKTEVAMRAAFKALGDGKQVAVLAPTTVLAFQHFETFKRAIRGVSGAHRNVVALPVARKKSKQALEELAAGQGGRRHRHASAAFEGRRISRSRVC